MSAKQPQKINDEQFLETFFDSNCSYAKTAKAIERKYGVTYTRQSAYERIGNIPRVEIQMYALREQRHTDALDDYVNDETNDIKTRIRIHTDEARRLSKYHLLFIKLEAADSKQQSTEPEGIFNIDGKDIHF